MPVRPKPIPEMPFWTVLRFLAKCGEPDENGCIHWTGPQDEKGYGLFRRSGKSYLAHRISYLWHYGSIEGGFVLHKCRSKATGELLNNRICVNPCHLQLGSQKENMRDSLESGTHAWQVLDFIDAENIRASFAAGRTIRELSRDYGMTISCIWGVVSNRSFVDPSYTPRVKQLAEHVGQIRAEYHSTNMSLAALGRKYGVEERAMTRLMNNVSYYDPSYTRTRFPVGPGLA